MGNYTAKLFITILEKLPRSCRWYVDYSLDDAFEHGHLLELKKYVSDMSKDYTYYYSHCIELTEECISYLLQELKNNEGLIYYICHHAITHDDEMLMIVYDKSLFTIHKSFGISDEFIRLCEENFVYIDVEDHIVL